MVRSVIVFAMGWTLTQFGFISGHAAQPESAVLAIVGVFSLGVIGLALVAIYYTTQMKLDRENHAILLEEIERIKAGGAIGDVPAHARAVAEELTGWKYEQCWGNIAKRLNFDYTIWTENKLSVSQPISLFLLFACAHLCSIGLRSGEYS